MQITTHAHRAGVTLEKLAVMGSEEPVTKLMLSLPADMDKVLDMSTKMSRQAQLCVVL